MIGHLRHQITFQSAVATPDAGGGEALAWSDGPTVWARITALSGQEIVRASQLAARTRYRLTIRYRDDVTSAMRIAFAGHVLAIDAVIDPDGDGRVLQIDCHEEASS